MTIKKWPFRGDPPVTRARKVALAYRNTAAEYETLIAPLREAAQTIVDALSKADRRLLAYDSPKTLGEIDQALKTVAAALLDMPAPTQTVTQLDARFISWGEFWHCEQPAERELDEYVLAKEGSRLIGITPKTLNTLRNQGRIDAVFDKDRSATGAYWYKVADLMALQPTLASRAWRRKSSTDTLNANGTGDST